MQDWFAYRDPANTNERGAYVPHHWWFNKNSCYVSSWSDRGGSVSCPTGWWKVGTYDGMTRARLTKAEAPMMLRRVLLLVTGVAFVAGVIWCGFAVKAAGEEVAYRSLLNRDGERSTARVVEEGVIRPDGAYAQSVGRGAIRRTLAAALGLISIATVKRTRSATKPGDGADT
jgi:hypothetical protein